MVSPLSLRVERFEIQKKGNLELLYYVFYVFGEFFSCEMVMNKFIGGSLDDTDFYIKDFDREVFYLTNIDTMQKERYLRTQMHRNGLTYTFWVFDGLDETLKAKRITAYLGNS
ncbi:hypothetical protein [Acinetobacter sp. ESBL14]|uniref:hypothetical protein n=1 Tax=Acinetobacter sp. ESBL14 TaxID=3077329 RepID=UPI002FC635A9